MSETVGTIIVLALIALAVIKSDTAADVVEFLIMLCIYAAMVLFVFVVLARVTGVLV